MFNTNTFIQHPIFKDRFIRKDKALKLFKVKCYGSTRWPMYDEHPEIASFWKHGYLIDLGYSPTLEHAVKKAKLSVHKLYKERDNESFGMPSFSPECIKIYIKNGKRYDLVLTGTTGSTITWFEPVKSHDICIINNTLKELDKKAAYERYCDCRSSAERLENVASSIKNCLINREYCDYVVNFLKTLNLTSKNYEALLGSY